MMIVEGVTLLISSLFFPSPPRPLRVSPSLKMLEAKLAEAGTLKKLLDGNSH